MCRESILLIFSIALAIQAKPIDEHLSFQSLANNEHLQIRPIQNIETVGVDLEFLSETVRESVVSKKKLIIFLDV